MLLLPLADGSMWLFSNPQSDAQQTLDLLASALNLRCIEDHVGLEMMAADEDAPLFMMKIRCSREPAHAIQLPAMRERTILWRIGSSRHPRLPFVTASRIAQFVGINAEQRGGILLHGALLEKRGKGVILAGPSGAGKTTAGRRLPSPWRALSDDMVLVVKKNSGEYQAHPWPTWSRVERKDPTGNVDATRAVPLQGLFFIQQSPEDSSSPLAKKNAIGMLLGCAEIATGSLVRLEKRKEAVSIMKRRFHNLFDLASSVPQHELLMSMTGRYWKEIERILAI